jgi:hypothetical protein
VTREELFGGGRKWRVFTEATGEVTTPEGVTVTFDKGHFEIARPGVFQSPISFNVGRRGVLLQEVLAGVDVHGSQAAVGEKVAVQARADGALA